MSKLSDQSIQINLFDLVAYWDKYDEKNYYGFVEELESDICKIFWFNDEILPNVFYFVTDAVEYRNNFLKSNGE